MLFTPFSQLPHSINIHHHYNQNTFLQPLLIKSQLLSNQQPNVMRSQTPDIKSQKYEDVSKQLDLLYNKLEQMDQTINHLSQNYNFSPQKKVDIVSKTSSTRYQPYTPQKYDECSGQKSNFEVINERISKFELLKGIKFGEFTYFGELNQSQQREGYGTLYDAHGRIIYTGLWLADKYHNRGKLFFYDLPRNVLSINNFDDQNQVDNNKVSYTGQFWYGQIKGLGQMLFNQRSGKERFVHYGKYENGLFNGRGTIVIYYGDFESNNVKEMQGKWKSGKII